MRIGVVSDTHVPERASELPAKLLKELKAVDMIVDAGDLVELGVITALRKVCPDVRGVHGNIDPEDVRRELPAKLIFKVNNFTIGVCHGYGPPKRLPELVRAVFKDDRVDLIIFGHSHQPTIIQEGRPWLFNPGSPTDTIFAPYKSFGIVEIGATMELKIIRL